jgi:hypothetical protein
MSRGRQYIQFEGYFAENVLGIFRGIRGFADLRDLAAVSVHFEMTEHKTQACRVVGHQRELNEKHALNIKNYLEQSDNRKANLRLEQLRQTLENFQRTYGISLELIDMGTEEGGTFPIHQKLTSEIKAILEDAGAVLERPHDSI